MLAELTLIDQSIKRRLAFYSFWEFCLWYDEEFFIKRPFLHQVAEAFQDYMINITKAYIKISVSMPPRAGKSYITSLFCAWWLAKFPELSVMRNTCTATLFRKFSYDARNIVRSKKYKQAFPDIQLADDKQNIDGWNLITSKQVAYFGSGVGGTIIGFGANIAITDDLYRNLDDAIIGTYNESVIRWKESAHDSRKEKNCPEIFIGTRWSKRDVIGRAIDGGRIDKQITIPALDKNGKSFCEDVNSTKYYLELRDGNNKSAGIDETIWMAEYMQEPIENKGLLFPLSELKTFNIKDIKEENIEHTSIFIDPADTGGDFYAALQAVIIGDKVFITDVIFNNYGTDINIPASVELAFNSKANYVQIEGNSGWILAGKNVRELIRDRLSDCSVRIVKEYTNKETRIFTQSAWIKHNVYFREDYNTNREYMEFINNVTTYLREGGNKHDDGADVLVMLAEYCIRNLRHLWQA
jgi:predicted phage terminase large subunit-like protein